MDKQKKAENNQTAQPTQQSKDVYARVLELAKKKNSKKESLTPWDSIFIASHANIPEAKGREQENLQDIAIDVAHRNNATVKAYENAPAQTGKDRNAFLGKDASTNMTLAQLDQYQAQQNAQRVSQLPPLQVVTTTNEPVEKSKQKEMMNTGEAVIKETPVKWDHYTQRIDNDLRILQANQKANPNGYALEGLLQQKLQDYAGLNWKQIDDKVKGKSKEEKRLAWHLYKMQEHTLGSEAPDQTGGGTEQANKLAKEKQEMFTKFKQKYKQETLNKNELNKKLRPQSDD